MARDYPFEFPVNVPSWYVEALAAKILKANLWGEMPAALANKINGAVTNHTGVLVLQDDLDPIPDAAWAKVLSAIKSG